MTFGWACHCADCERTRYLALCQREEQERLQQERLREGRVRDMADAIKLAFSELEKESLLAAQTSAKKGRIRAGFTPQ